VFRRFSTPDARALAVLAGAAGLGLLGCLPGAAGAGDPVTLLAWLALSSPALGAWVGSTRIGFFPFALAVPAAWGLAFVLAHASAPRPLPSAPWALCALAGLFGLGFAIGRRARAALGGAGAVLLATLALAGAPVGCGVLAGGAELARSRPRAAARLLDLSPLVLVLDCAGLDWTHAQDDVYRRAGVEWFTRRSFRGDLAGPAVLVVGCALALLVRPRSEP
jgi:hypothetical protein